MRPDKAGDVQTPGEWVLVTTECLINVTMATLEESAVLPSMPLALVQTNQGESCQESECVCGA